MVTKEDIKKELGRFDKPRESVVPKVIATKLGQLMPWHYESNLKCGNCFDNLKELMPMKQDEERQYPFATYFLEGYGGLEVNILGLEYKYYPVMDFSPKLSAEDVYDFLEKNKQKIADTIPVLEQEANAMYDLEVAELRRKDKLAKLQFNAFVAFLNELIPSRSAIHVYRKDPNISLSFGRYVAVRHYYRGMKYISITPEERDAFIAEQSEKREGEVTHRILELYRKWYEMFGVKEKLKHN